MRASPTILYLGFVLWGVVEGLISYLILAALAPFWWGDVTGLLANVAISGTLSAIVFALLWQKPRGLTILGFFVVGLLSPTFVVIVTDSIHYHALYFPDLLTIVFLIIWTVLLVPVAISGATIYWFVSTNSTIK